MRKNLDKIRELFVTTFIISASTSGGYAIVGLIKDKVVNKKKWVSEDEMSELLAIAQTAPGPIAINTSIILGYRLAGSPGAIITMLGTALPPLIIMSIVAVFYEQFKEITIIKNIMRGMLPGVSALLVNVTIDLFTNLTKQKSILSYVLFVFAFIIIKYTNISVLFVAIACALAGVIKVLIMKEKK